MLIRERILSLRSVCYRLYSLNARSVISISLVSTLAKKREEESNNAKKEKKKEERGEKEGRKREKSKRNKRKGPRDGELVKDGGFAGEMTDEFDLARKKRRSFHCVSFLSFQLLFALYANTD
ncbi:MAG: hypothetical protein K6E84_08610 [Lachnospiraceae bacterium]|nr:hypothetical protein [Lachnospiraceae bacterium]